MAQQKSWKWSKARKRWLYDFKDSRLNIPRKRAAFKTETEAEVFHLSRLKKYLGIGQDQVKTRLFGEALAEYLETVSSKQQSHADNLSNAAALRIPYEYKGIFYRLEDLPLDDSDTGILTGLNHWLDDQLKVTKRAYLNKEIYQLRHGTWYHQPNPAEGKEPKARKLVGEPTLISRLNATKGRGLFSADTLRLRQQLTASVLTAAYKKFRWTQINLADLIDERIEGHEGHQRKLNITELSHLIHQAHHHSGELYALLIMGAARIGWRRANLSGLTWSRVVWPYKNDPGFLFIPRTKGATFDPFNKSLRRERTKNSHELCTVMDDHMEQLLRRLWDLKDPDSDVVFHDGTGNYWGESRKRWNKVKELAGIDPDFRWHDLRHTWASELVNAGIDDKTIMEQQGWQDPRMIQRYGHKDLSTRAKAIKNRTMH